MGTSLLAERLGCTKDEAQKILDDFYSGFPKVKNWKDGIESKAKETGYVEDLWGRRRRLVDLNLPKHQVTAKLKTGKDKESYFNPLLGGESCYNLKNDEDAIKFTESFKSAENYKDISQLKKTVAQNKDLEYTENGNRISTAERQCVNFKVQGSAATMTKKAMILVHNDKELNDLGFKLLIPVHDELIGECPKESAEKVADRLSYLMAHSVEDTVKSVPFKCDAEIEPRWYFSDVSAQINEELDELMYTMSNEDAKKEIMNRYPEFSAFMNELIKDA